MNRDEIFAKIKECVQDVLAIDDDETDLIQPDASLTDDLGAESIDFVEIIHLLSGTFDIEVERNEAYPDRDFLRDEENVSVDGQLTDKGTESLIRQWPHLNKEKTKDFEELLEYLRSITLLIDFLDYRLTQ